jgi:hypothetical protein
MDIFQIKLIFLLLFLKQEIVEAGGLAQKKTIQPTFSILRLWSEGKGIKPSSIN